VLLSHENSFFQEITPLKISSNIVVCPSRVVVLLKNKQVDGASKYDDA